MSREPAMVTETERRTLVRTVVMGMPDGRSVERTEVAQVDIRWHRVILATEAKSAYATYTGDWQMLPRETTDDATEGGAG